MFVACGIWCLAGELNFPVCSDEGLTLKTSAKHHIPQATNKPYQPLLIKSILSVLAHAENQFFSQLVFQITYRPFSRVSMIKERIQFAVLSWKYFSELADSRPTRTLTNKLWSSTAHQNNTICHKSCVNNNCRIDVEFKNYQKLSKQVFLFGGRTSSSSHRFPVMSLAVFILESS